jgi:hypothetical protein
MRTFALFDQTRDQTRDVPHFGHSSRSAVRTSIAYNTRTDVPCEFHGLKSGRAPPDMGSRLGARFSMPALEKLYDIS